MAGALKYVKRSCPNEKNLNAHTIGEETKAEALAWAASDASGKAAIHRRKYYDTQAGKDRNALEVKRCKERRAKENKDKPAARIWRTGAWCQMERNA